MGDGGVGRIGQGAAGRERATSGTPVSPRRVRRVNALDDARATAIFHDLLFREAAMNTANPQATPRPGRPRLGAPRLLLHALFLLVALGCFAAYAHFKLEGRSGPSMASLVLAAIFAFAPVRDLIHVALGIEGKSLHFVHGLGSLGLLALPVTGVVSSTPVLAHAWMGPFAIMGAAQALMHQNHPRNAQQAAAMRRFEASLPEVAAFADSKSLTSPSNARREVAVLSDVIGKAQALGQTELESDPGFQGALRSVSSRLGTSFGLDAVDLALRRLAASPTVGKSVPALRRQLEAARAALAHPGSGSAAARS
jgi:hypothetical protein